MKIFLGENLITCSFCLRTLYKKDKVISGDKGFICINCISLCLKIFLNFNLNCLYPMYTNNKKNIFEDIYYYINKYLIYFIYRNIDRNVYLLNVKKYKFLSNIKKIYIKDILKYKKNFLLEDKEKSIFPRKNIDKFNWDFNGITKKDYEGKDYIIDILINFEDNYIYPIKWFSFNTKFNSINDIKKQKIQKPQKIEEVEEVKNNYKLMTFYKVVNGKKILCNYSKDMQEIFFLYNNYPKKFKFLKIKKKISDRNNDIFKKNINIEKIKKYKHYDKILKYYFKKFSTSNFKDINSDLFFNSSYSKNFFQYYNFFPLNIKEIKKYKYISNKKYNFNLIKYIKKNMKNALINKNINFSHNFNKFFSGYYNLDFENYIKRVPNKKSKYIYKNSKIDILNENSKQNKINFYNNKFFRDNYKDKLIKSNSWFASQKIKKREFLEGLPTPKEFKNFLDRHILGQDSAKQILSVALYNNFKRLKLNFEYNYNLPKNNILIIGPSGSGKTYMIQTLRKLINLPFVIADATTLTEAGYIGEDVESLVQKLFIESNFDIEKTEIGVIYIDEIDKIGKKNLDGTGGGRDISGEGVQQALLKLIEGTICQVCYSNNRRNFNQNFVEINTENILFICGGAFANLDNIMLEKFKTVEIGFGNNKPKKLNKLDNIIETEDLVKFGLIPELIGRLPIIAKLNDLDTNNLIKILKNPDNSIVSYYNILLSPENIKLTIDDDAIELIAKLAYKRKTGARGLRNIIDTVLHDILFEAPNLDTLREIIIHKYIFEEDLKDPLLVHYDWF